MKWADTQADPQQALDEALRLQRGAAEQGFDWPELAPLWDKLHEEIDELKQAVSENDATEIQAELGDLFFMLVNLSRFLGVKPDAALDQTNRKFIRRMRYIEQSLERQGLNIQDKALETLEALWQQSKRPG